MRELEEGGYLGGLSPQNPESWSHREKNIRQTQTGEQPIKHQHSSKLSRSSKQRGKTEKLSPEEAKEAQQLNTI